LAEWFGQYFSATPWALALAGLLLLIAKTIEVVQQGKTLPPVQPTATHEVYREGEPTAMLEVVRESPVRRWLWG
jgi:hypothetical protein